MIGFRHFLMFYRRAVLPWRLCRALSALALLSVLTTQIGAAPPAAAQNVTFQTFRCGDGTEFVAAFFKGTRAAYVQLDGKKMTLPRRLLSISGTRYSAGGVTLRIKANAATLSRGGRSTDCSEV